MHGQNTYLTPGFLVTLLDKRQEMHFTQIPGLLKRGTLPRIAVVDALNRGYRGDLKDLVASVADRYDRPPAGIEHFLNHLRNSGFLGDSTPAPHFKGEPGDAPQAPPSDTVTIPTPVTLIAEAGQYVWYDHHGTLKLRLNLEELIAVSMFAEPATVDEARDLYCARNSETSLDEAQFESLMRRVTGAGLFVEPSAPIDEEVVIGKAVDQTRIQSLVDAKVAAHDEALLDKGVDLTQVIPVNTVQGVAPAALGLLIAYAMEYEGGELCDKYNFVPMFLTDEARLVERAAAPAVVLFSNYVWNVETNLKLSEAVKAVNPRIITIHGGPSTPSFEKDCEQFFIDNPHVDVAVRGEGELTFSEILKAFDGSCPADLGVLHDVEGLTYRTAAGVCRTGNRERIADLDTIPSPYLMGMFDEFGSVSAGAVIESNRGCPYGCTFCDWGSATLSKVRRFDLERVYKELEWSATHKIKNASLADANFGMLERDVDITKKIADLKRKHGFPLSVAINFAKNKVTHLRDIIQIMADVGLFSEGVVSLQTTDVQTLDVIERSNIKLDKYDELATEFRKARLPLAADIMMGLPGATPQAFKNDLQRMTDRDIRVRLNQTQLLPNSPMNEPNYRKEHGVVALPGEILQETASYTREEWDEMEGLRQAYYMFESYAVLRYVSRYVRRESGMGEVEFFDKLRAHAVRNPAKWPIINTTCRHLHEYMAPPGSWGLFIDEVHQLMVTELGLADDSGLRTALGVQLAHLPAPSRVFPESVELEHDYVAWQSVVLAAREEGHRDDWEKHVPRLSEFGPTTLVVHDPEGISLRDIGKSRVFLDYSYRTWELDSPLARPRLGSVANAS